MREARTLPMQMRPLHSDYFVHPPPRLTFSSAAASRPATDFSFGQFENALWPIVFTFCGLPDGLDGILRNHSVAGDDSEISLESLRDKQPVKRVAMDIGQRLDALDRSRFQGKNVDAAIAAYRYDFKDGKSNGELAKALLYGDFPERNHTDKQIPFRFKHSFCRRRKFVHRTLKIYEDICVEQIAYHIYSLKHSRGSSKSGDM